MGEVERECEIADIARSVAGSQRLEVPPPFDELQDRRVVEDRLDDAGARRAAARERRRHHDRNAEAEQSLAAHQVGIDVVGRRRARRRHVVEEATPFVVGDDEDGPPPGRSVGDGVEGLGEERVACAYVRVRMVVVRRSLGFAEAARLHERDVGERAGGRVLEELVVTGRDRLVLAKRNPQ